MAEIRHPEWRDELEPTKYPFSEAATLRSGNDLILNELFLDAVFYPVGNSARLYLSQVLVTHSEVTLTIGTAASPSLASGTFNHLDPPSKVAFEDQYGRPSGVVVSEPERLAVFQSWSVGTHTFNSTQTEFAAAVSIPTPEIGLRGIVLEDGSFFSGDVWMVGDDGVVLRRELLSLPENPAGCDQGRTVQVPVIRVDIVGDPLFRRRLCTDDSLFATPRYVEQLTFTQGVYQFSCSPDAIGDIKVMAGNHLAEDTVLRIRTTAEGIIIEAVGEQLEVGQV